MKNQTDLIVTIVAVLCMLIGVGVFFGTKKEATTLPPPEAVVTTPLQLPAANVAMAASLPGAGNAPSGGFGGGAPGGGRGVGFGPAAGGPRGPMGGPVAGGPGGPGGSVGAPIGVGDMAGR